MKLSKKIEYHAEAAENQNIDGGARYNVGDIRITWDCKR